MLVLRRRADEVIVFEGGLTLTVLEVAAHRAWLAFEGPSVKETIALCTLEAEDDRAVIGVRSPATVEHDASTTRITLHPGGDSSDADLLSLHVVPGDRIEFDGLSIEVVALGSRRATLAIDTPCLSARVSVTVQSITGAEARIGIEAPEDLRVYRKELWVELLGANRAAATWSNADLDELVPNPQN